MNFRFYDGLFTFKYESEYATCPLFHKVTLKTQIGCFPVGTEFKDCMVDLGQGYIEFRGDKNRFYKFNLFLVIGDCISGN